MMTMEQRLQYPAHPVDVVLDTDAYNEIDDQFAIAYLLHAGEKLTTKALYAAPFLNKKSTSPADGMEKSYDEILKLLDLAGRADMKAVTFKGSTAYLPDERTPVDSPAARHLAALAMQYTMENPLYVVAIGAITNVASALLLEPSIKDKMVLVWLGGNALHWPNWKEFNLRQDVAGARVVFGCGVPLVQLPCFGVVDILHTTGPELNHWLKGKNALCDYLAANTISEAESYAKGKPWSRVIWDVAAVGWLLNDNNRLMKSYLTSSPVPQYDGGFSRDDTRHPFRYVYTIHRDALFADLFSRLTGEKKA